MKALRGQVGKACVEELRGQDITASKPAVFPGLGICPHICLRGHVRPLTVQCRASLHKHRPGPDEWANHRDWCSQLWGQEPIPKVSQGRAPSQGPQGRVLPAHSRLWRLQRAWVVASPSQSLRPSSRGLSLCVCAHIPLIRSLVIGSGPPHSSVTSS